MMRKKEKAKWEELEIRLRQRIVSTSDRIQNLEKELHKEEDLWEKVHVLIEKEKQEQEIAAYQRMLDTMHDLEGGS